MRLHSYTARSGDTLLRIARRSGVSPLLLEAVNPQLERGRHLAPGTPLAVPLLGPSAGTAAHGASRRIVQAGAEYGPAELERDLAALLQRYPSVLAAGRIGESVLGRSIPWIRFGRGRKRVHMNAACHGNEWITSLALMTLVEDLACARAAGLPLRGVDPLELEREVSLWLVPMVNPDGVRLAQEGAWSGGPLAPELVRWNGGSDRFFRWKANARGVDLNDQFPAHWEEERRRRCRDGPGPRDYTGTAPLSEPESRALASFTDALRFDMVVALHTQGQEIYWNYRDLEPPEAEAMAERMARAAGAGYRAVKLGGSDAGFKDWFIQAYRKPGFTVEAGLGVNPLPLDDFPQVYDELAPLLLTAMRL